MNILAAIRQYATVFPDRIAVRSGMDKITYGELWTASDLLADWLLENNPSPGEPIAVYGHKHPWMIVCFLGCVKAGCAYCPIDLSVPGERVKAILHTLTSGLMLTTEPLPFVPVRKQVLDLTQASNTPFPQDLKDVIKNQESSLFPDQQISDRIVKNCKTDWISGDSTYYIIFTSGSTGTPKGVQISADCLNHYLDWSVSLAGARIKSNVSCSVSPQDTAGESSVWDPSHDDAENRNVPVFLNQAPFSFDLSVMDLYTCLAMGGTLYCLGKTVQSDYARLMQALGESHTSVWVSTPSFADMCLSEPRFYRDLLPELDTFLFCGETLQNRTVKKLHQRFPDARIFNTYGPTESTVAVTGVLVTPELNEAENPLPVGRAKPGTFLEIRDENGQPLPDGEKGEIIILGDTVSTGYYLAPELTERAFFRRETDAEENMDPCLTFNRETSSDVNALSDTELPPNSVSKEPPARVLRGYHTGDKGYLKNGLLYYCGRIDLQVKLHGYRIELEDIENNLRKLPDIRHAVVLPNIRNQKVSSLTAYVTEQKFPNDTKAETARLKEQLSSFLPDYMIPKKFVFLEQMPMTINGKADRRSLEGMQ
ncbi:MAG: D-alanine--poly(phosphoribitol) ligase subunit DltA [Blautia sp.]|nr:D-alanine--poly(phosphoribitol) ligase subunit DltA [Blautia sp.]